MDETDHKLLALLRQDARLTVAALAAKLKVSRQTVTRKLQRISERAKQLLTRKRDG